MTQRKLAIVTGGTKGIGRGISEMLLASGYEVVATYATDEQAARRCTEELGSQLHTEQLFLQSPEAVRRFCEKIASRWGALHCLVCNAGTTLRKDLAEMTEEEWGEVMQVNVNSSVFLVKYLRPLLTAAEGQRSVVFIGSLMGIHPHGTSLAYGVTKSAVHALARNLVKEFDGEAVNVNAIAPGFVETEWQREKPAQVRANICAKTAVHRFATVEEVASAVRFCIENPFVNGTVVEVSGGYSYR